MTTAVEHLYVHVPFCAAKCDYCAFYSEAGSARLMDDYVDAVLAELQPWRDRLQPRTIFFGGGTPTLLPMKPLEKLLTALDPWSHGTAEEACEFTVECNPATVSADKARLLRERGVNRISLGVQALDDGLLQRIGRVHSRRTALESFARLREAGFGNINLDLMFGLPGQTRADFQATLAEAIALAPEHISTYCLILEEDTEFWSLFKQGLLLPNEEEDRAMYELAIDTLTSAGYQQYEISNFARTSRECAHNLAYWEGRDYVGLGPSACSTVGERRWQTIGDTARYIAALQGGTTMPLASSETVTPALRTAERAAFGMRLNRGVPADVVRGKWDDPIKSLLSAQLVEWHEERLRPTRRGLLFADEIAAEFV